MRGRPEKPTTRRSGWTYVLATDRVKHPPKLPAGRKWPAETRAYWKAVWASPFAILYGETDVQVLKRLMVLHAKFIAEPQAALSTEMRRLEEGLGLTPQSRLRLRWALLRPEPNGHAHPAMRATRPAGPHEDPRHVLDMN